MKKALKATLLTIGILLPRTLYAADCIPAPSGLVGWWTGDNNFRDLSPYRNDIFNTVNVNFAAGKVASSFLIDGATSEIVIPQSPSLTVTSLTFAAWVYPRDLSTMRPIIEYGDAPGWSGVQLAALAGGELFVNIRDNSNPFEGHADLYYTGGTGVGRSLPQNTWSFVVATFDAATATSWLYLNGVLLNGPNGTYLPSTFSRRTNSRLNIGFRPNSSFDGNAGHRFDGMLDEVQVFNRALSPSEITAIYSAGADGQCRPNPNVPPQIIKQPQSISLPVGGLAIFNVDVLSSEPVGFQWLRGDLVIRGATSNSFAIGNVQLANAGDYKVIVTNKFGLVVSNPASLTVYTDEEAPKVTITSPLPGVIRSNPVLLTGNATDNLGVELLEVERNGSLLTGFGAQNGPFSIPVDLLQGTNILRVIAYDAAGNRSSATVQVISIESTRLAIPNITTPEGQISSSPVLLTTHDEIGAMDFTVSYDPTFLAYTNVQWLPELGQFAIANEERPGLIHLSFALSGTALSSGTRAIATLNFRARSVPTNSFTGSPLEVNLLGAYLPSGAPQTAPIETSSGRVLIMPRHFPGDNNSNDRLDVSDASVILGLITGLSPIRAWDISGNDLNQNFQLDSGDVVRVLRAAVGIDPQPRWIPPAGVSVRSPMTEASVNLRSDKSTLVPGDKITINVALDGMDGPLSGAAFKLEYPKDALRLESSASHRAGSLVPSSSTGMWNISPAIDDYARQDGTVYAAFASGAAWPASSGELAVLTFTVLQNATSQPEWSIQISKIDLASGLDLTTAPPSELKLKSGNVVIQLTTPAFLDGVFQFRLLGEVGARYRVQVSENLATWAELSTYENPTGEITIRDSRLGESNSRFYRAMRVLH
jgi:hypothetical protein